ncbi:hypothetical protein [Methylobacterium sp. J-067]|uniref:hypothetical protein n=1 Tax=Methylobacterium sp. J-067 TaxID=2836648 RepID=UPI001FBA8A45|nr:hypothetical protein [Methylobacterium sp. J-067]MCJ2023577.1 hypothetical protein [Methylobacterium sp. J-067]
MAVPVRILQEWTGQPLKVCYRCMERACDRGLIEYGVSLRCGWIDAKGYELLGMPGKTYLDLNDARRLELYKRLLTEAGRPVTLVAPPRQPAPPAPEPCAFVSFSVDMMAREIVGGTPAPQPWTFTVEGLPNGWIYRNGELVQEKTTIPAEVEVEGTITNLIWGGR